MAAIHNMSSSAALDKGHSKRHNKMNSLIPCKPTRIISAQLLPRLILPRLHQTPFCVLLIAICTTSLFSLIPRPAAAENSQSPVPEISTIDNPAPYRHLDWVQQPSTNSCCEGLYLPPTIPYSTSNPDLAPIKAASDHYDADGNGKIVFDGDVIIQQGGRQLESDHVELNQKAQTTLLEGNVRIRENGMLLTGDKATFSLISKDVDIQNAEYVIHESHIHGEASRIYNNGEKVLTLDQGSYTTCEPNSNAWLFEADDITLNNESGWGTAKNATLKIKDVPVFYFPWVMFPVDDRRQTGFLFPTIGFDDDNGTDISAPLYLNLTPNMDATLTFRNMTRRGSLIDGEFRYLFPFGEGQLGGSYLAGDKLTDTDRKLALFKHKGDFSNGWSANVDYTKVSDEDYFTDLGTTLDANAKTHLDQKAQIGFQRQHWSGSMLVQNYQTLDELIADNDKPYRKVPQIRFNGNGSINSFSNSNNNLPIEWDWLAEFTQFEHPEESSEGIQEAQRTHLSPSVSYNFLRPWGYIRPKVQGYFTTYDLDGDSDTFNNTITDRSPDTSTYTASLDTGLTFERPLSFNNQSFTQTLEPRLFYLYSPEINQNDNPTFDSAGLTFSYNQMFRNNRFSGVDRVGDADQVSLGLTTRFLDANSGKEKLRASVGQIFYLQDREVQLTASTEPDTDPRSALVGQLAWPFSDNLTLYSEIQWDEQRNHIDKTDVQLTYRNEQHQIFNAAYRQQGNGLEDSDFDNSLEQTDLSTAWSINQHWSFSARWIYDVHEHRTFESLVGVTYDSCCWSIQLMRHGILEESDTLDNNGDAEMTKSMGTFIQFQFKGLGGVGTALESILDKAIYGYEERRQALSNQF